MLKQQSSGGQQSSTQQEFTWEFAWSEPSEAYILPTSLRKLIDRSNFVCTKCKLVSILEEKIEGLEQITTMRCIRETEDFLDKSQDVLLRAQSSKDLEQVAQRSQEASEEAWQHVTSRRRRGNVQVPVTQIQFR
ncbi:uncharacterized protein LOC144263794 [Eretmochelys imbricata]